MSEKTYILYDIQSNYTLYTLGFGETHGNENLLHSIKTYYTFLNDDVTRLITERRKKNT